MVAPRHSRKLSLKPENDQSFKRKIVLNNNRQLRKNLFPTTLVNNQLVVPPVLGLSLVASESELSSPEATERGVADMQ